MIVSLLFAAGDSQADTDNPLGKQIRASLEEKRSCYKRGDFSASTDRKCELEHAKRMMLLLEQALPGSPLTARYQAMYLTAVEKAGVQYSEQDAVRMAFVGVSEFARESAGTALLWFQRLDKTLSRNATPEPILVEAFCTLGTLHHRQGRYTEAAQAFERSLQLAERVPSLDKQERALLYTSLGAANVREGQNRKAHAALEKALSMLESPDRSERRTAVLASLARLHLDGGEPDESRKFRERALREIEASQTDSRLAEARQRLAAAAAAAAEAGAREAAAQRREALKQRSDEEQGRRLFQVSLSNMVASQGVLASALDSLDLATLDQLAGGQRQALDVHKVLVPELRDIATAYVELCQTFVDAGELGRARELCDRGLKIDEENFGKDDPTVVPDLAALAHVHVRAEEFEKAAGLFERGLQISRRANGDHHPETLILLQNLAVAQEALGKASIAQTSLEASLQSIRVTLGPRHPVTATVLHNLANALRAQGKFAEAHKVASEALAIRKEVLGDHHADVAVSSMQLASLSLAQGDSNQALAFLRANADAREKATSLALDLGTEAQKLAYVQSLWRDADTALSLHLRSAPQSLEAARLAASVVLRRQGRVFDATLQSRLRLEGATSERRAALERLRDARAHLAILVLRGPATADPSAWRSEVQRTEEEVKNLEASLPNERATPPPDLEAVQRALSADEALVVYALYRPHNPKGTSQRARWEAYRYGAWILRSGSDPVGVDLAAAADVDRAARTFRSALSSPSMPVGQVKAAGRALDRLVFEPVRSKLGKVKVLHVSPEGVLNLVPFQALVDEGGRYSIESMVVANVTGGRDLVSARAPAEGSDQRVVVFASPDFGPVQNAGGAAGPRFSELPGTRQEAAAIRKLIPAAQVVEGQEATKAALQKASAPAILHIATHGFFLGSDAAGGDATRGLELVGEPRQQGWLGASNPLLRSGLALAGANAGGEGRSRAILTALEASSLELRGTRLVVLSACETGVGEVAQGDGVFGMRRALATAGAESLVMSLWKIDDEATTKLIEGYYRCLLQGDGRAEALRNVQLSMLQEAATAHPYYWAAFVLSGQSSPLLPRGSENASSALRLAPARGCGCETPGRLWGTGLGWISVVVALVLAQLRSRRQAV